jgi:cation transport regulator
MQRDHVYKLSIPEIEPRLRNRSGSASVSISDPIAKERRRMPYRTNQELPDSVKNSLPSHAQDIYREAFDNAWSEYQDPAKRRGNESLEEVAHRVAWAAVKKKYEKVGEEWQPKD